MGIRSGNETSNDPSYGLTRLHLVDMLIDTLKEHTSERNYTKETIEHISQSDSSIVILTDKGHVFSVGKFVINHPALFESVKLTGEDTLSPMFLNPYIEKWLKGDRVVWVGHTNHLFLILTQNNRLFYTLDGEAVEFDVNLGDDSVKEIAYGLEHVFVTTKKKKIYSFGHFSYGSLGNAVENRARLRAEEVRIDFTPGDSLEKVYCGYHRTMVLTKNGQVWACGWGKSFV